MKNIDESSISSYENGGIICSICKKDKISINSSEIKEKKIKELISIFDKKSLDPSILIKKCKCHNNTEKVHKFCLLLNIIFSFELKCNECKASYNIDLSKSKNKHKYLCNLISFIFLLLFHLILYAGSIFLMLFVLIINKNVKNDFEENKLYNTYNFFGGIILIINSVLVLITFSYFLDKNNKDIYDYFIDVKDINEQNKIDKNSNKFYSLLYKYYRCFYNSQIRYLIGKKQEYMYISKGYGYFNKDLKEYIKKSNEEIKMKKEDKNREEIKLNNGAEDILSLNVEKGKKILNETQKNNNTVNKRNNSIEESNGININKIENNKIEIKQKNEEEEKNDNKDKDKEKDISEKRVNNDNYKVNENNENKENKENKENVIKDEFEEKVDNQNNLKNEEKVDINLNDEEKMKENKEKEDESKKASVITFNKLSVISNKVLDRFSRTSLFKKVLKKNNDLLGKSKTLINNDKKRKRRKSKKSKREKQVFKKIEETSEKKYIDSTLLIRAEKMDSKIENKNCINNENKMEIIEKKSSALNSPCHYNEK